MYLEIFLNDTELSSEDNSSTKPEENDSILKTNVEQYSPFDKSKQSNIMSLKYDFDKVQVSKVEQ